MVMLLFTATPTVQDVNTYTMQTFKQFLEDTDMHQFIREKWLHLFLWEGHRRANSATAFQQNANKVFVECAKLLNRALNDYQAGIDVKIPTWVILWTFIALERPLADTSSKAWRNWAFRALEKRMKDDEVWEE